MLIFLDIDGTLVAPGSNVPPQSALDAIVLAKKNGHKIFLCTGRNLGMVQALLQYEFDGIVGSSGGYVTCGNEVLVDKPMSEGELQRALKVMHEHGIFVTIEGKDYSFADSDIKKILIEGEGGNSEIVRWRKALEESLNIKKMEEYDNQPIYKAVMMSKDIKNLHLVRQELEGAYSFMIQDSTYRGLANGELLGKGFDKGTGIKTIVNHLGMNMEDTVGFGDSMNDIEMAEVVGTSVCMANGSDSLKAISDIICPSVEEDGLYKGFEMLGLI